MTLASKTSMEYFEYEVKKWYRSHSRLKLDHVLSYFDNEGLKIQHYCAPINLNNNHWVTMDVTLPTEDLTNGRVIITNHMHTEDIDIGTKSKASSTYHSQMWWAKTIARIKTQIEAKK